MYTREALAAGIARAKASYNSRSRILVVIAVGGGVGQLWLHRILESRYERSTYRAIELALFVVYMLMVVPMIIWLSRAAKNEAPKCQACGAPMTDMTARIALTTGRCDHCGAQVIE